MDHPHIRSFHPRRSRTSPAAASALVRLLPVWSIDAGNPPPRLSEAFTPTRPVILEVGPGMGVATLEMAASDRTHGIVAVDVHTPGIGLILAGAESCGLDNVRVCVGDAVDLMGHLEFGSLAGIRIFFPDPWPKARHHKRRLVQPHFIERAAHLLAAGGTLHMATDIPDYAQQMLDVCSDEPLLLNTVDGFAQRPPWRPVTKFELRGAIAGRDSHDVIFSRIL